MSTAQVVGWLQDAAPDLDRLLMKDTHNGETREVIGHAMRRAFDTRPALPGPADDTDRVSGSSSSGAPPGFGQRDVGEADRMEAHRRAKRIRDDVDWLFRFAERWNPHEATAKDRQLSAMNEKDELGCEHCATIGKWEKVYVDSSTVKGNLVIPMRLGYFCYRYTLDTGTLPTRKQLEDHHNGVRVKRPA